MSEKKAKELAESEGDFTGNVEAWETPMGKCKLHGEQFYLFAKYAGAKVCAACVAAGLFVAEITTQIEADYPLEMKQTRAETRLG